MDKPLTLPPMYYVLLGHAPVLCHDLQAWATWMQQGEAVRRVARTPVKPGVDVSTVFLGVDHSYGGPTPLLFETMVFGGVRDGSQDRYATWDEAAAGHAAWVARVKESEGQTMTDHELEALCQQRQELAAIRDQAQTTIDDLSTQIGTELALRGVDRAEAGEYVAQLVDQHRRTLDKQKLVEVGVTVDQIEAATVETRVCSVRVSRRQALAALEAKLAKKKGKAA